MTYVEKMALKAWDAGHRQGCEEIINQIIADTKRACKKATRAHLLSWQKVSIGYEVDQAEVKER